MDPFIHSTRLWGPGRGSAITRVSNSRWNWAVFSLWRYLHLSHLTFLPWGVRNDHILCLLFIVLPIGLQGVSPPTWLHCTSCHETPIKRFFWSPNSWVGQCRGDVPTLVAHGPPGWWPRCSFGCPRRWKRDKCCPSGDGGPCCRDSSSESPEYSCVLGRS